MLIRFVLIVVTGSILIPLWMNIRMQYLKNIISDTIKEYGTQTEALRREAATIWQLIRQSISRQRHTEP